MAVSITSGIYEFRDFQSNRPQPRVLQVFPPHEKLSPLPWKLFHPEVYASSFRCLTLLILTVVTLCVLPMHDLFAIAKFLVICVLTGMDTSELASDDPSCYNANANGCCCCSSSCHGPNKCDGLGRPGTSFSHSPHYSILEWLSYFISLPICWWIKMPLTPLQYSCLTFSEKSCVIFVRLHCWNCTSFMTIFVILSFVTSVRHVSLSTLALVAFYRGLKEILDCMFT